jgi:monothiol glutaredoxin
LKALPRDANSITIDLFVSDTQGVMAMATTQDIIREQVTTHPVVLYMKGTPQFPQCGFSSAAVQMLKQSGAENFFSVNVLADNDIRQGIKEYANWPTVPQLYVNGEFIGGADIMREMYDSGELQQLLTKQAA